MNNSRNISHLELREDIDVPEFINGDFSKITHGTPLRPYILPGKSNNSKYHLSTSEGINGIVDEVHIKTEEAFCFLPKKEKLDLIPKIAEIYLDYGGKYDIKIARTVMQVPEQKFSEYHDANAGLETQVVDNIIAQASARDWNTEWRRTSDNASRPSKLIATGAIAIASIGSCYLFSESFPFEAILGIGSGTFMVGVPLINTKKSKALKKIANSEVYISLY